MAHYDTSKEKVMLSVGSLSLLGSLFIIATLMNNKPDHRGVYYRILYYIAFSDGACAIGAMFGGHDDDSLSCWFQAFLTHYFSLTGIFWATALVWQLKRVIFDRKNFILRRFYFICWIVPLVMTLLPLSTHKFGPQYAGDWCFIAERKGHRGPRWAKKVWRIFSFYIWLLASLVVMIYQYVLIKRRIEEFKEHSSLLAKYSTIALDKVKYHPLVFTLSYIVAAVVDISSSSSESEEWTNNSLNTVATALMNMPGLCCCVIFIVKNPDMFPDSFFQICFWNRAEKRRSRTASKGMVMDRDTSKVKDRSMLRDDGSGSGQGDIDHSYSTESQSGSSSCRNPVHLEADEGVKISRIVPLEIEAPAENGSDSRSRSETVSSRITLIDQVVESITAEKSFNRLTFDIAHLNLAVEGIVDILSVDDLTEAQ